MLQTFKFKDYRESDPEELKILLCDRVNVHTWREPVTAAQVQEDEQPYFTKYHSFVLTIDNIFKMNAIHSRCAFSHPLKP